MKRWVDKLLKAVLVVSMMWPDTNHYFAQGVVSSAPWVGTWSVAPSVTDDDGFNNQTVRQIVHTSIGGTSARIHLSNLYGTEPLVIGNVHIARRARGKNTIAGSDLAVTFGGQPNVTIPVGASIVSDSIAFQVPALADVAISLYLPQRTPPHSTGHVDGLQDVYIAPGDAGADPAFAGGTANSAGGQSYYFLTNLDVQNAAATGAVVAFGASITDGLLSRANTNRRWPNRLAVRLQKAGMTVGVLNQGISGNDFFTDNAGQAGLTRFDRDVLQQPGVKWVIVSDDAVNDLNNDNPSTAPQLIAAFRQLIDRSHRANIKLICSTLTPFDAPPAVQAVRQRVNAFILSPTSGCDAVLDQASAVSDPTDPAIFLPAYNGGDDLHPNDAGLQAIADAVDLDALSSLPPIQPPSTCGQLGPGQGLASGQKLTSCAGRFALNVQADGDLTITQTTTTIWSAGMSGSSTAELRMQENGNLVAFDFNGAVLWESGTSGNPGAYAYMQDDGTLVIYALSGAIWSSR
ncbi:lipase/acylhydrolase [Caballeronia choica]|uniref:Lipase/acylhydrolase n=1 Tax=Caballeronia choica TaxID=326476 RepID=A0A158KLY9_9BURK|nr:lipase/acylhydrolase [Caballeronia choica]